MKKIRFFTLRIFFVTLEMFFVLEQAPSVVRAESSVPPPGSSRPLQHRPHIAFFPAKEAGKPNVYWDQLISLYSHAANALGVRFTVHPLGVNDRFRAVDVIRTELESNSKPDVVFTSTPAEILPALIEASDKAKVSLLSFAGLDANQLAKLGGEPRKKHTYWRGHFMLRDEQNAFESASVLFKKARTLGKKNADSKTRVIALTGGHSWPASQLRLTGFHKAVKDFPEIFAQQSVFADWSTERAKELCGKLLKRFPNTQLVWAASDAMALGAIEAVQNLGKTPGKDILIGSLDASPLGLQAIYGGKLTVSRGSLWTQLVMPFALIHDFSRGLDFASDSQNKISTLQYLDATTITASNVAPNLHSIEAQDWRNFPFEKISRITNPSLKSYRFKPDDFIDGGK